MRTIVINGEVCEEVSHKEDFNASCIICKNKEMRDNCSLFNIKFKKNNNKFVCECCMYDPLECVSKSTIIECAKDLKMTTKAFLKALEVVICDVFFKDIKECRTMFYSSSNNTIKNKELMFIIHKQKLWIDNQFAEDWKEICKGD